uniref:V-SNARE coiled-coil homology domain-containing protein n=1 Tax=Lotharella globosa TaxID=91324 RepID=A0A7S4DZS4_9EUKA
MMVAVVQPMKTGISSQYFTKNRVSESMQFGFRTVGARTALGSRQSVRVDKDTGFLVHAHARTDGLCCLAITDEEYPSEAIFVGMAEVFRAFLSENKNNEWRDSAKQGDHKDASKAIKALFTRFQDPKEADKALKIKEEIKNIKGIMAKNIEQLLEREETLVKLAQKSEDLSLGSKALAGHARSLNSCCRMY